MKDLEHCSFCGKSISDVNRLIRSPMMKSVYICDTCNSLISSLISDCIESNEEGWRKQMKGKAHPPRMHRTSSDESNLNSELCSLKPSEIRHQLDKFIIGQERAKKVLSVAIYNHWKRLNDESGLIKKSNILMIGPSGSGKTLVASIIANILNVPFVSLDATKISATAYVGNDAEVCLQQLVAKTKGNVKLAERGIVYIDEIDKLAQASEFINKSSGGLSINTQAALLKLIEGCEITLPAIGKVNSTTSSQITMDTSNILFICGGAFWGLNDSRKQGNPIGFCTSEGTGTSKAESSNINHKDIIKYGLMQELVGRLPILITLDDLDEDDLLHILVQPENSFVKEYQMLFEKDGVHLQFDDDALEEIARMAFTNKTGVRGLRTILENVLDDIMYELPDMENITECRITKDTIITKTPILIESKEGSEIYSNNA